MVEKFERGIEVKLLTCCVSSLSAMGRRSCFVTKQGNIFGDFLVAPKR